METKTEEIGDRIYRFSTCVEGVAPGGFTFNQFLVLSDDPLLFHCGQRALFPLVSAAVQRVVALDELRWISFGHVESDECGALNAWLAAAPRASVVHGQLGCEVSIKDLSDRPPRAMADGEVLDLGTRRLRLLATPHVPHNWESIAFHEEVTNTLFCGDILTTVGDGPALVESDLVEQTLATERMFGAWSLPPTTPAILERLAALGPGTLAAMHGSSFRGDGARALRDLAGGLATIARERGAQPRDHTPA